jgi:peptide-methionine (R)-S-oxide reductase
MSHCPTDDNAALPQTDEESRQRLTPEQFHVARRKGTEPAFSGEYHDCKKEGVYRCACCGEPLFRSSAKFDSGTGWSSFFEPMEPDAVKTESDDSFFMQRTEVLCAKCNAHLGHVFDDGPPPTGLRYCINSVCLKLDEGRGRKDDG